MAVPSPVGDVKTVSSIGTIVLNMLTLKLTFHFIYFMYLFYFQEVKSSRDEQSKDTGTERLDNEFQKLKSEFAQTHESVSFYCLMEFFREMSMRDDHQGVV